MKDNVSVILPCFNEGRRIIPIINEISKSKFVKEIIVVDDGSEIYTKNILRNLSNVKIIEHKKNLGKAKALETGFLHSTGEIIVFIDSDLSGFEKENLGGLITPITNFGFDMVLGEPEKDYLITRWIGSAVVFTGERALKRLIIENNMSIFNCFGYQIESKMNDTFFYRFKIAKVLLKNTGPCLKMEKIGIIYGIIGDLNMTVEIVKFVGLRKLFRWLYYSHKIPLL